MKREYKTPLKQRKYAKAYYRKHKQGMLEYAKEYRKNNLEKFREYKRKAREAKKKAA